MIMKQICNKTESHENQFPHITDDIFYSILKFIIIFIGNY